MRWHAQCAPVTLAIRTSAAPQRSVRWASAGTACRACAKPTVARPPRHPLPAVSSSTSLPTQTSWTRKTPNAHLIRAAPAMGSRRSTPPVPDLPREEKPAEVATISNTAGDLIALRRTLTGKNPPLLPRPWYTYTLAGLVAALADGPGQTCPAGPAAIVGGAVIPAPVATQAAMHATITTLVHPGQAPPEPRYRPSRRLAEFVRCRDQTCRFPGCSRPSTITDIDHTIAYPYGPTCASNLACLCREHHLLKTFWPGWSNQQFPDGTIIWTDPEGSTSTTYPGSKLLFPELCAPTAEFVLPRGLPPKHTAGLTMPKRTTTRAQARRQRIDEERRRDAEG